MFIFGVIWERKFDVNVILWIKEDGKLFILFGGVFGVELGKFEVRYNNVLYVVNLIYIIVKDVIFGYLVIFNGQFFNSIKDSLLCDFGIYLFVFYRNYII